MTEAAECEIKEQLLFVEWLKDNGMYNELDSAQVMRKAHAVWAEQQREVERLQVWERFAVYLIDRHEGDVIYEEGIQQWLSAMLDDEEQARKLLGENNDRPEN